MAAITAPERTAGAASILCILSVKGLVRREVIACRLPTTMQACRWRIGCICRRPGAGRWRRGKAKVPEDMNQTKPEIALDQLRWHVRSGFLAGWCC